VWSRSGNARDNTILGRMQSASTCPTCGGSGQILDKKAKQILRNDPRRRNCFNQNSCRVVDGMQLKFLIKE
jgi:molecular chaperone DnaJ